MEVVALRAAAQMGLAPGRLTRRAEFLAAAGGRRFHTARMTVQGLAKTDASAGAPDAGLRVGFTVTKKVGHATERNRIRRRLRVAARSLAEHAGLPLDLVVIARREALGAPFPLLVEDLGRAVAAVTKPGGERRPDRRSSRPSSRPTPAEARSDPPSRTP